MNQMIDKNLLVKLVEKARSDFVLLLEAGFIAVKQLRGKEATSLFKAAQLLRPEHPFPKIGLGYFALSQLETKLAASFFQDALKLDPENQLAQMFLAITYAVTKTEPEVVKAQSLIEETLRKTNDPSIQNLGKTALDWINKDIKKTLRTHGPIS